MITLNHSTFYVLILTLCTALIGSAQPGTLDPAQKDWFDRYHKQTNRPDIQDMRINTESEPDLSQGFTPLFNGKDLTGWTPKGGSSTFEAEDGMIIGSCVKNVPSTYLCTDNAGFSDFIFTCDMKWDVDGNSGVMFRAQIDNKGTVTGPQFEMEAANTKRGWSGGIYGQSCGGWYYPLCLVEHEAARNAVNRDGWNRITIMAKGPVVKTWINGTPAAHWKNGTYLKGYFGLQIHKGVKSQVAWKNIRIKRLEN